MNFKPYLTLFYSTLLLGIFISLSANNWITVWMGLELNLYSFIPILLASSTNLEKEAAVKYFLVQALASALLLLGSINPFTMLSTLIFSLSLIMKLGIAPCHFWLPSVMNSLPWNMCWILSTLQKIAPLFILIQIISPQFITMFTLIAGITAMTGGIGGLNQTQMRPILAYSSIGHMGWILAASMFSLNTAITYFFIYILILSSIMLPLYKTQSFSTSTLPNSASLYPKMFLIMGLLSLSGIPPFLGFFPKLFVISSLISMKSLFLSFILVLSSSINLFFYLKIITNSFFWLPLVKPTPITRPSQPMLYSLLLLMSSFTGILFILLI